LGQVSAAEGGVVDARDITPTSTGAREQWEYKPNGALMTVYDPTGAATTLARCPAKS
jgi:hypothetical protein